MKIALALIFAVTFIPCVGFAEDPAQPKNELDLLGGIADIRRPNTLAFGAIEARFAGNWYGLHPYAQVGFESGGSAYGSGGILYNLLLPGRLHDVRLTLGTGPGLYLHNGASTDLGNTVEFYSWVELSTTIFSRRVGVSISHLSNAHLSDHNPGIDGINVSVVVLTW
jgi:hypothetical protein